jgi:hypothetical protein
MYWRVEKERERGRRGEEGDRKTGRQGERSEKGECLRLSREEER